MMDLDEALSRSIDGDLDEAEAAVLRQRIADDPEVARRYGAMLAMVHELEGLPDEIPVPVRPRRVPWGAIASLMAAAALVFWLARPAQVAETLQTSGTSQYGGLHRVSAGDLDVAIDGVVAIRVEPARGVAREREQEDSMKAMSHALAAAAGALVTITVYEGTATVQGTDAPSVTLEAGGSRSFGGPTVTSPPSAGPAPVGQPDPARVAELEEELDRLREELGQERFAKILMKGQLEAERGLPTEWPADVSAQMSAEGFPDALAELAARIPDVELVQTDCEEYPCVGALRYTGQEAGMEWMQQASREVKAWVEAGMGDQVSLNMSGLADGDDADASRYMMFGAHADERGSNTSQRLGRRMEELGTRLIDEAAPE